MYISGNHHLYSSKGCPENYKDIFEYLFHMMCAMFTNKSTNC